MRLAISLALASLAAGCSAPAPGFRDRPSVRMDVSGHLFDIRVSGHRAEAIRLSPAWAPRLASVGVPAVVAIEAVSGCRVARLSGDQARMEATLDCGTGPSPAPAPHSGALFCEVDLDADGAAGVGYCVPEGEVWPRPG